LGPVYQAGTLSGNPLAVAAGRVTLRLLNNDLYAQLERTSEEVERRIGPLVKKYGCSFARVGSMFTIFFRASPPENFSEVLECDFKSFGTFHRNALNEGLYFPPSQYEAVFLGIGMGTEEINWLEKGIRNALMATFSS